MIFESFIEDSLKPVHGLITKERLIVFSLTLVFFSPDNFAILELLKNGPSVSDLTDQLSRSLKSLPAIPTFFAMVIVFFFSAKTYQLIARVSNKLTLKKINTIITKLQELEKKDDAFFTDRVLEINFEWKSEKEVAETKVKRLANFSETFISMSFICTYLTFEHNASITASSLLGIVAILYSIESSRKILISYLTHIATYKIASTRLSKISGNYSSQENLK